MRRMKALKEMQASIEAQNRRRERRARDNVIQIRPTPKQAPRPPTMMFSRQRQRARQRAKELMMPFPDTAFKNYTQDQIDAVYIPPFIYHDDTEGLEKVTLEGYPRYGGEEQTPTLKAARPWGFVEEQEIIHPYLSPQSFGYHHGTPATQDGEEGMRIRNHFIPYLKPENYDRIMSVRNRPSLALVETRGVIDPDLRFYAKESPLTINQFRDAYNHLVDMLKTPGYARWFED
jgi:hypothetical protein